MTKTDCLILILVIIAAAVLGAIGGKQLLDNGRGRWTASLRQPA